ncbi:MAG: hypothetical protein NZ529_10465 [Cytophagaceae bacterium]|nr:hypothetical protein [Cytophagaceae bacterium]MDW8457209.1 hypothetical protein [Cytophagaceae bacterium]
MMRLIKNTLPQKYSSSILPLLFFFCLIFLSVSCRTKKNEPDGSIIGYDYYPIQTGLFYIYEVTERKYNGILNGQESYSDTLYYVKELIFTPITINDETKYQVYRFYKTATAPTFDDQPDSVWTVFNDRSKIIKAENNYRYIKLIFPPENGRTWDGNALNFFGIDIYTAAQYRKPFSYTVNNETKNYPSTVTVIQEDEKNLVNKDYRIEVYAQGVGMVYKQSEYYEYEQPITPANRINVGKRTIYKLISHGIE